MRFILINIFFSFSLFSYTQEIDTRFDKNIELFGYIVHLAEPSNNNLDHPISKVINANVSTDSQIELLPPMFEIASTMEYSFLIELMLELPELPFDGSIELSKSLLKKSGYRTAKEIYNLEKLVGLLNEFASVSSFESVWKNLREYRLATKKRLEMQLRSLNVIGVMEEFYQQEFDQYELIPSLTILTSSGWGIKDRKANKAIFVLAPLAKNYNFSNERFESLMVHEFGHSFVNHVVDKNRELVKMSQHLYDSIGADMASQGYPNWIYCVYEHFVRAGEVMVPELNGDATKSQEVLNENINFKSFIYLSFIVNRLRHYRIDQNNSYKKSVKKTLKDLIVEYNLSDKN
ncbi:DUF4932 domain-containing protein [Ekhidna sp.]